MVKYATDLDQIFVALSDATRRDILQRLKEQSLTVGEIAAKYKMSLAAVSKHVSALQNAGLVKKRIDGTSRYVELELQPVQLVGDYLDQFETAWSSRLQNLAKKHS